MPSAASRSSGSFNASLFFEYGLTLVESRRGAVAWLPRLSFPVASAVPPASHSRQINYSSRIAARYWRSLFWYRESPLMANKRSLSHTARTSAYPPGADIQYGDGRFVTDFVCFTPGSRLNNGLAQTAGFDPKATLRHCRSDGFSGAGKCPSTSILITPAARPCGSLRA